MRQLTIPGGPDKGKTITQASDSQLEYWASQAKQPDVKQACAEELRFRGGGKPATQERTQNAATVTPEERQAQQAPRQSAPIEKAASAGLAPRIISDAAVVNAHLEEIAADCHLVSPVTQIDLLPPGCGVSVSYVRVDPNPDPYEGPKEVYTVGGGRLGLSKLPLDKIAAAANLSWSPERSGRLDNRSHPFYVYYRAVGTVQNFDGTERTVYGEVEMDLRDGSPQLDEIIAKAAAARTPRDPKFQIQEMRKFILRQTESKAMCRAVACLGVKRSYTPDELQRPFAVARVVFTGRSDDPELQRQLTLMNAQRFLGARSMTYGNAPPLGLAQVAQTLTEPPALDSSLEAEGYQPDDEDQF